MVLQFRHTYECDVCNLFLNLYSNANDLDFPKCNCDKVAIKTKTIKWDNEDLDKKITVVFDLKNNIK